MSFHYGFKKTAASLGSLMPAAKKVLSGGKLNKPMTSLGKTTRAGIDAAERGAKGSASRNAGSVYQLANSYKDTYRSDRILRSYEKAKARPGNWAPKTPAAAPAAPSAPKAQPSGGFSGKHMLMAGGGGYLAGKMTSGQQEQR